MPALATPPGYRILDEGSIGEHLASRPACAELLGGDPAGWKVAEVGDGNLNQVFIVAGPAGSLVAKQALPYLRLVGEAWPLPLSRAYFEQLALRSENEITPALVPKLHAYDPELYCIVMEHLQPHEIMRKPMIAGKKIDGAAAKLATFMARNLFLTSDLHLAAGAKRQRAGEFGGNHVLCGLTENVIFTEPYIEHANNRWTAPHLDGHAARWRADTELHAAVSRLKLKFLTEAQALLHGDLHTGSIMTDGADIRVIDPEFAFFGPMGFDVGKLIANFLISFFSQRGHENAPGARDPYRQWLLQEAEALWTGFDREFRALWNDPAQAAGDAWPRALHPDPAALAAEQDRYLGSLYADAVGFCGTSLTRRVLGIAHNIDYEHIADEQLRASCEARALELSHRLLTDPGRFGAIGDVLAAAEELDAASPELSS
ncbi:MAG: S-methyl-5-thioribose kinase [Betaproteobacteria bacterium AqS2]|uniref:S-methyl-5-thioribose kinase n=1 Tax=Candidatus Amphirhobacter heronislandensis TaxID=1732024 RepID=A0A930Y1H4_9GAMM|nr:S-methyl-5-thioribose kinase [Betaproteobacteria bacterium AqS2]